jgi:hypothetical protein
MLKNKHPPGHMGPRIDVITLAVSDLEPALRF